MNKASVFLSALVLVTWTVALLAAAVEADPEKEYLLSPKDGSHLIYVASFHGDQANEMARKLVHELRSEYNLPACMFSRSDQQREEQRQKIDEFRRKYGVAPRGQTRVIDQYAVFVSGYRSEDSARRALEKIKKQRAPDSIPLSNLFATKPKTRDPRTGRVAAQEATPNPFSKAWVARNPLLPSEKKEKPNVDPFLVKLNKNEPYSLLECRQPWTLQVSAFHGAMVVQTKKAKDENKLFGGKQAGESLVTAALNAQKLAEALRSKESGLQTYILHTRESSIVTVGGFRGPNDPALQRTQQLLAARGFKNTVPMPIPRP